MMLNYFLSLIVVIIVVKQVITAESSSSSSSQSSQSCYIQWANTGAGLRSWAGSIGFANLLYNNNNNKTQKRNNNNKVLDAISISSGSTWFAVQFIYSKSFYDMVTTTMNSKDDSINKFVLDMLNEYETSVSNPITGACQNRYNAQQLPGFQQQFIILCEFVASYNNSWFDYNYMILKAFSAAHNDTDLVNRLVSSENRILDIDVYFQASLAPNIRINNQTTYYGPKDREDSVYTVPIPLTWAVKKDYNEQKWILGIDNGTKLVGKISPVLETTFDPTYYQSIFGSYPLDDNMKKSTTTELIIFNDDEMITFDWKYPFGNNIPTIAQLTAATTAVLAGYASVIPQLTTSFYSLISYAIKEEIKSTTNNNNSSTTNTTTTKTTTTTTTMDQILIDEFQKVYETNIQDGLVICSQIPNDNCTLEDSILYDALFSDLSTVAQSLGEYQKSNNNDQQQSQLQKKYKLLLTVYIEETEIPIHLLFLYNTTFNKDIEPGEIIQPELVGGLFPAYISPIQSPQIFQEYIDNDILEKRVTKTTIGSVESSYTNVEYAILNGTTINNPIYNIQGGQNVEILYILIRNNLPSALLGKTFTILFKSQYAKLAYDISNSTELKKLINDFIHDDSTCTAIEEDTTSVPTTSTNNNITSSTLNNTLNDIVFGLVITVIFTTIILSQ